MKSALRITVLGHQSIKFCICLLGVIAYAHYESCDPLTSGKITNGDQLLPYFVSDILGGVPGLLGLFMAALFSAALSTMSSNWNTWAGLVYQDFIRPLRPNASEKWGNNAMKLLVLLMGCLNLGLVFVIGRLGSLFSLLTSVYNICFGIIGGIFIFGTTCRKGNTKVGLEKI